MKKIIVSAAAIGLMAGLATPTLAQMATTAPAPAADAMTFAGADANADGMVSMEEAQAAAPGVSADFFGQADANADGNLDETEFEAFLALATGSAEAQTTNENRDNNAPSNSSN